MPFNKTTGKWEEGGLLSGEDAVSGGLTGAAGLIANYKPSPYPAYVPSQTKAPSQQDYMNYTPNQPMAQITTPNYQLKLDAPTWNSWNPQQQGGYGAVDTQVQTQPWNYQSTNPNAQAANYKWNDWNALQGPQGGYGTVNTQVQAQPWNFQSINPNAQVADYKWSDWKAEAAPEYERVGTVADAAKYQWKDTPLSMERIQNPYAAYSGEAPSYQTLRNTPSFQGLMEGDYNALQKALQTPGEIAAERAYKQGQANLANTMGGSGLYGSSIMANQARQALETPYQETLAANAANAAAQRYGLQASDLQAGNQFGMNVYGQQMAENQAANAQAQRNWETRLNENLSGLGLNMTSQQSNQSTNAALQSLLAQQGIAMNQGEFNYANLLTNNAQQNIQNALSQATNLNKLKSSDYETIQGLMANQNLAKNAGNLQYAGMQTEVNKQNAANALAQAQQQNALGLNYAQLGTQTASENAARALQQQQQLNTLNSSDLQQLQGLMASQNLAQNAGNLQYAGLQTDVNQQNVANALAQSQQQNALGLNYAQLGTQTASDNAARALQQQQQFNALNSSDLQQLQGLMANQNLAQNQFGQNVYNQQMAQNQNMNQFNQQNAQLGMQQNQNLYNAGVSDAARQQDYNLAAQTYENQRREQQRQWENQQALEQMQYQLASGQYNNEQQQNMINQYLALAGRGQVTAGQNAATDAQQAAAQAQQNAALYGGLAGLGTTGGLIYGLSNGWFG